MNTTVTEFKDHTDPEYVGPGAWNTIHRMAFSAKTKEQQTIFIQSMNDICSGFPCLNCRYHCSEYIRNHPMEEYVNMSVDVNGEKLPLGLFLWSWKFHNAVNARLKKPIMDWNTAYNIYSDNDNLVCNKNCSV